MHRVQHARRDPHRVDDLDRLLRRERRRRRGLEHDGAAGGERGAHLVRHERQRKVPRRDCDDDPDRSAHGEAELVLVFERHVVAAELVRESGEELEVLRDPRRLDHRVRERLALLESEQPRDLGNGGLHLHRCGVHERRALRTRKRGPRRKCLRRGLDRRVDLRRRALGDRVYDLAVRGIPDLDRLSRLSADGLTVDEHRCHEEVLPFGGRNAHDAPAARHSPVGLKSMNFPRGGFDGSSF